ncbi:MAG TPA: hypothetical protein VK021_09765 [Flavobacteriaceae bacterium]|nr:hypothetical protein [Flavobacteriaceae bacterium]
MTQRFKLADVAALRERQVFFDANILIYLFWPTGQRFFEDN